ncbi:MAG: aminodeoxychorismate/anthranilate synthase component II [Flavobacteriales bacterium]|nr:aminodeoxychorismate/anthranilate synthase component II [Flavobacteriales bacterium]
MEKQAKIVVIDNFDSFTYNLVHYLEGISKSNIDVFRNNAVDIDVLDSYDCIILSPGPGLPNDAGICKQIIEKYYTSKKILGVCLGMQAIGEVFGGKLINLKNVYHGLSTPISVLVNDDALFRGLPVQFEVGRYHSWVINPNTLPKDLLITSVDFENNPMSIRHIDYPLFGVQFHPESILTPYGKAILENFLSV